MKEKDFKKMIKALELLKKSQELMAQVESKYDCVKYDSNAIMRHNSLAHVVSIMESTILQNLPEHLVNNDDIFSQQQSEYNANQNA